MLLIVVSTALLCSVVLVYDHLVGLRNLTENVWFQVDVAMEAERGSETWVPPRKEVYWPPTAPENLGGDGLVSRQKVGSSTGRTLISRHSSQGQR